MADTKISALTNASALGGTEQIPGVQSAANVNITPTQIKTFASASPTLVTPNIGVATGTSLDVSGVLETGTNGGTNGQLKLLGSTSGDVTVKPAAAAGTATVFQLPSSNGTVDYVLRTDGAGVTSWVAQAGGAVTSVAGRTGAVTLAQADIASLTTADVPVFKGAALTGGTVTASTPLQTDTQTWNSGGVTFVGKTTNITDTASAAASLLERWQVGGVDKVSFDKGGIITIPAGTGFLNFGAGGAGIGSAGSSLLDFYISGGFSARYSATLFGVASTTFGLNGATAPDVMLTRVAAATLQHGAANAASPVAQIITAQGSRVGTDSNVAGGNLTIKPGVGTGNATPSSLILSSWIEAASGTSTQTAATGLTIQRGQAVATSYTVATLPAGLAGGVAYVTDGDASLAWGATVVNTGAGATPYFCMFNGTNWTVMGK